MKKLHRLLPKPAAMTMNFAHYHSNEDLKMLRFTVPLFLLWMNLQPAHALDFTNLSASDFPPGSGFYVDQEPKATCRYGFYWTVPARQWLQIIDNDGVKHDCEYAGLKDDVYIYSCTDKSFAAVTVRWGSVRWVEYTSNTPELSAYCN